MVQLVGGNDRVRGVGLRDLKHDVAASQGWVVTYNSKLLVHFSDRKDDEEDDKGLQEFVVSELSGLLFD